MVSAVLGDICTGPQSLGLGVGGGGVVGSRPFFQHKKSNLKVEHFDSADATCLGLGGPAQGKGENFNSADAACLGLGGPGHGQGQGQGKGEYFNSADQACLALP